MYTEDSDFAYPADIPASNKYLMSYHAQMVQNITGLVQDHSMPPIVRESLSPDSSSFPTSLPSEIPAQRPTSVTTYTHMTTISDLPLTLSSLFPSNMSSDKPI